MSRYALFVGLGCLAVATSGKILIAGLKKSKLKGAKAFQSQGKLFQGPFETPMTRKEASLILGIKQSAGEKQIQDAHKRLMLKNHPDNGGSTYVATKINEAKDILIYK